MSTSAVTLPESIHYSANEKGNRTRQGKRNIPLLMCRQKPCQCTTVGIWERDSKKPKDVFAGNRDSEKQLRNLRRHAKQFQQKMLP